MTEGVRIDPEAVYDDGAMYCLLGLSAQTLARSRKDGSLKFSRKGMRILYLGRWLLDWIAADAELRRVEKAG